MENEPGTYLTAAKVDERIMESTSFSLTPSLCRCNMHNVWFGVSLTRL